LAPRTLYSPLDDHAGVVVITYPVSILIPASKRDWQARRDELEHAAMPAALQRVFQIREGLGMDDVVIIRVPYAAREIELQIVIIIPSIEERQRAILVPVLHTAADHHEGLLHRLGGRRREITGGMDEI